MSIVLSAIKYGFKVAGLYDAKKNIEKSSRSNNGLLEKANRVAQKAYLNSTFLELSIVLERRQSRVPELYKLTCSVSELSDCVRDLLNKQIVHKTFDPRNLGVRGALQVAADIAGILKYFPSRILQKISPILDSRIVLISEGLNGALVVWKLYDIVCYVRNTKTR